MRSSGSRVDIAQKPNKSGQILDQCWKIVCVIFTKLIPRRIFFFIAKILVLMVFDRERYSYHEPLSGCKTTELGIESINRE